MSLAANRGGSNKVIKELDSSFADAVNGRTSFQNENINLDSSARLPPSNGGSSFGKKRLMTAQSFRKLFEPLKKKDKGKIMVSNVNATSPGKCLPIEDINAANQMNFKITRSLHGRCSLVSENDKGHGLTPVDLDCGIIDLPMHDTNVQQEVPSPQTNISANPSVAEDTRKCSWSSSSESELEEGEIRLPHKRKREHTGDEIRRLMDCNLLVAQLELHEEFESFKTKPLTEQLFIVSEVNKNRMKQLLRQQNIELEQFKKNMAMEKPMITTPHEQGKFDQYFRSQRKQLIIMQVKARNRENEIKEQWMKDARDGLLGISSFSIPLACSGFILETFKKYYDCNNSYASKSIPDEAYVLAQKAMQDEESYNALDHSGSTARHDVSSAQNIVDTHKECNGSNLACKNMAVVVSNEHAAAANQKCTMQHHGYQLDTPCNPFEMPSIAVNVTLGNNDCEVNACKDPAVLDPRALPVMVDNTNEGPNISPNMTAGGENIKSTSNQVGCSDKSTDLVFLGDMMPIPPPDDSQCSQLKSEDAAAPVSGSEAKTHNKPISLKTRKRSSRSPEHEAPFHKSFEFEGIAENKRLVCNMEQENPVIPATLSQDSLPLDKLQGRALSRPVGNIQVAIPSVSVPPLYLTTDADTPKETEIGLMPCCSPEKMIQELSSECSEDQCSSRYDGEPARPLSDFSLPKICTVPSASEVPCLPLGDSTTSAEVNKLLPSLSVHVSASIHTSNDSEVLRGETDLPNEVTEQVQRNSVHMTNHPAPPLLLNADCHAVEPGGSQSVADGVDEGGFPCSLPPKSSIPPSDTLHAESNGRVTSNQSGSIKLNGIPESFAVVQLSSSSNLCSSDVLVLPEKHSAMCEKLGVISSESSDDPPCKLKIPVFGSINMNDHSNGTSWLADQHRSTICADIEAVEGGNPSESLETNEGRDFPEHMPIPSVSVEPLQPPDPSSNTNVAMDSLMVHSEQLAIFPEDDRGLVCVPTSLVEQLPGADTNANNSTPEILENQVRTASLQVETAGNQMGVSSSMVDNRPTDDDNRGSTRQESNASVNQALVINASLPPDAHYRDPLENELLRIRREQASAFQLCVNEKERLLLEFSNEMEKVKQKYIKLVLDIETAFEEKRRILNATYSKIQLNQLLAKDFKAYLLAVTMQQQCLQKDIPPTSVSASLQSSILHAAINGQEVNTRPPIPLVVDPRASVLAIDRQSALPSQAGDPTASIHALPRHNTLLSQAADPRASIPAFGQWSQHGIIPSRTVGPRASVLAFGQQNLLPPRAVDPGASIPALGQAQSEVSSLRPLAMQSTAYRSFSLANSGKSCSPVLAEANTSAASCPRSMAPHLRFARPASLPTFNGTF